MLLVLQMYLHAAAADAWHVHIYIYMLLVLVLGMSVFGSRLAMLSPRSPPPPLLYRLTSHFWIDYRTHCRYVEKHERYPHQCV